jgi:hypothetical protein
MFDGSGWEIVDRNEQNVIVRKYGFDGDDYYDTKLNTFSNKL